MAGGLNTIGRRKGRPRPKKAKKVLSPGLRAGSRIGSEICQRWAFSFFGC